MAHFYLADDLGTTEVGATATITGAEARHAVTVSRIVAGEHVAIGDGLGRIARGAVVEATPASLSVSIESIERVERSSPAIVLAQALAKGDRDELAIQAATELGVDAVLPWAAQRSISKWEGSKLVKGHERWAAVVREASKQSIRAWVPDVLDHATTKQVARLAAVTRMLVLEPTASTPLTELELDDRDLTLVVGPEGGVSPGELELLVSAGAELVRLGATVLRTSTAGPAAIAVLNARLGRW